MFCLSLIEHNLQMPPHLLSLPLEDAVRGELERLFLDKVVANLGLCVSVYDIHSIEGGIVFPGEGHSTYKVVFRLLMFRPFVGEIIIGKVEESDPSGLRVSLGFFNDIYVPEVHLQQPCIFREDGVWVWTPNATDESEPNMDEGLPLDLDAEIRFRVVSIKYPPIPLKQEENTKPFAPMEIIGSINGDALGLTFWF